MHLNRLAQVVCSCARRTVTPSKTPKLRSLEQRKVYWQGQARKSHGSCSKTPNSPVILGEKFLIGKIRGEGCRMCDLPLIGFF